MAKIIHPLSKINPTSECWRIMVRVIRLYTLPVYGDAKTTNSIEMVFMDKYGSTIHATVRRSLVGTFERQIKEGSVYIFAYFGIGISSGNYRTSQHEFRLNFQPRTTVTECSCDKIPIHGLNLRTFTETFKADSNYPYLVDSMGILAAVGKEKDIVKESKITNMIVITLEAEGMTLDITLFGEYVNKVKSFFDNQPLEHAVIVIQYAKVKTFQGNIILQNDGTSENLKEFGEFLLGKTFLFKVEHLVGGSEVVPRSGSYYCNDCMKRVVNLIPRYRIRTRVIDTSDSVTFVVFENVGCLMLHKSCSEMMKYCETNITLGLSIGEKSVKHSIEIGETLSYVKNLIEDFVESKNRQLQQNVDDMKNCTPNKRMQDEEHYDGDGDHSTNKMKTIKIEKTNA